MEPIRVAVLLPDADNEYYQAMSAEAHAVARELDIVVEVAFAHGDCFEQARQIHTAMQRVPRPDALAVMAVQESMLQTMASHVVAANTAWICLNRGLDNLDDLRTARSDLPIGLVMPDHVEAGRIQARQVASLLPQGGHVLYVVGRSTNASTQQRARGFKEVMARLAPRIEIVGQIDGNWMATDAAVAVSRWMLVMLPAGLSVDAIVCQSDFMAAGVRNALRKSVGTEEVDFRRIPVLGCDGVDGMGKRLVDQGELASTVVLPTTTGSALKAISAHFTQGVPFPAQLVLPPLPYPDEAEMAQRWWQVA